MIEQIKFSVFMAAWICHSTNEKCKKLMLADIYFAFYVCHSMRWTFLCKALIIKGRSEHMMHAFFIYFFFLALWIIQFHNLFATEIQIFAGLCSFTLSFLVYFVAICCEAHKVSDIEHLRSKIRFTRRLSGKREQSKRKANRKIHILAIIDSRNIAVFEKTKKKSRKVHACESAKTQEKKMIRNALLVSI